MKRWLEDEISLGCHLLRIYFSFDRGLPPAIEPANSINSPFLCWVSAILRSCWPLKPSKLNHGPMSTWCYDVWTIQSYPSHNRWLAGLPKRVITQIPGQESIVFQQFLIQVKWHLQPDKLEQLVLAVSGWDPLTWDVFLILFKEEGVQMTTLSWPSNLFAPLAVETTSDECLRNMFSGNMSLSKRIQKEHATAVSLCHSTAACVWCSW